MTGKKSKRPGYLLEIDETIQIRFTPKEVEDRANEILKEKRSSERFLERNQFIKELLSIENNGVITESDRNYITYGKREGCPELESRLSKLKAIVYRMAKSSDQKMILGLLDAVLRDAESLEQTDTEQRVVNGN